MTDRQKRLYLFPQLVVEIACRQSVQHFVQYGVLKNAVGVKSYGIVICCQRFF